MGFNLLVVGSDYICLHHSSDIRFFSTLALTRGEIDNNDNRSTPVHIGNLVGRLATRFGPLVGAVNYTIPRISLIELKESGVLTSTR